MLRRAALVLAPCAIGVVVLCTDRRVLLLRLTEAAQQAEELGPAGLVGYVLCFVVATLMMIPTGPLEMAAGLLFTGRYGLSGAIALAAAAKQISGSVGYLLGRTLFRESVQEAVIARPATPSVPRTSLPCPPPLLAPQVDDAKNITNIASCEQGFQHRGKRCQLPGANVSLLKAAGTRPNQ
eukprot:g6441.t1